MPGGADINPIARLINLSKVSPVQIRVAHEQADSRHLTPEHFDRDGENPTNRRRMIGQSHTTQFSAFSHLELILTGKMSIRSPCEHDCTDELFIHPYAQSRRL